MSKITGYSLKGLNLNSSNILGTSSLAKLIIITENNRTHTIQKQYAKTTSYYGQVHNVEYL